MKRKYSILIMTVILIIGIFTGCGSKAATPSAKNVAVKDIADKIKQSSDISAMKDGNAEKLNKFYGIAEGDVEEFALFTAPSNIKADEILVIKVKDAKDVDSIKGKITKRIDKLSGDFKDYLPDEYDKIQKNVVSVKGNYILFVVSKDADNIVKAFGDSLK